MKLKALIVDDEPLAHDIVMGYADALPFLEVVGQCHSALEAIEFLNRQSVDLIFLDINMPKLKGLDFLRTLSEPPLTIVTTAYEEYAVEGFELSVVDYLLKPFRFERFVKAVNRALEQQKFRQGDSAGPSPSGNTHLFIKSDKRFLQIPYGEIHCLESYGNYVKVWMDEKYHLTPGTLTQMAEQLPGNQFLRVHKSFVVGKEHVDYLEGNMIFLKSKKEIPLSKTQKQAFKRFMGG